MDEPRLGDGQVHPKSGQWEFGVGADFDFAELSRTMKFVGTMMIVFGALTILAAAYFAVAGDGARAMVSALVMLIDADRKSVV